MIDEDYKIYFAEFGEPVKFTGSGNEKIIDVIFERDIVDSFMGEVTIDNHTITAMAKTEDVSDWTLNASLERNSVTYYCISEPMLTDNDNISLIPLSLDKVQ